MPVRRLSFAAILLVALSLSGAYDDFGGEISLLQDDDGKFDPKIDAKHLAEVSKINSFKDMTTYIARRMDQIQKAEMAKDFTGHEEIAIGNTIKTMTAKRAVQDELNSEIKVDCEVGNWGTFAACDKLCGGGHMTRKRAVTRDPQNGGKQCPLLDNKKPCNSESCASEAYARRAARRKLTKEEKRREMAANEVLARRAMNAPNVKSMLKQTRKVMRKIVHTHMAEVKLPNETGPRSAESLVRKDLKAAMAKNAVNRAMEGFRNTQKNSPKQSGEK